MMRAPTLLMCLMLTGCLTNEPAPSAPPATPAASAAAPAAPAAPDKPSATPAQRRQQPIATRGNNAPPSTTPQPEEVVDPVLQVRQQCWSQGNDNKSFKSLEARADWVNKCIADKTKALGL